MRHLIFLLLSCFLTALAAAEPIPIKPLIYEWYEPEHYVQQTKEWEAIAKKESCAQKAWYHYYMAAHYANIFGHEPAFDLDRIHQEAEKQLTEDDFMLHYLRCRQAPDQAGRWKNLLAAHAVDPGEPIAYPGLALYYELIGDETKRDEFMHLVDEFIPYAQGNMDWNYNQLQSVEDNAILLTHGDNDTYPTWLLQGNYGVKPSVTVLNLPLLMSQTAYRKRIFSELQLDDPSLSKPDATYVEFLDALAAGKRAVYVGVGAPQGLIQARADQLYLTGLTFRYDQGDFNNLGALVENYRNWRLDELRNPLDVPARQRVVDQLNRNYLPALLELHDYYEQSGQKDLRQVESLIDKIAERSDLGDVLARFSAPPEPQLASATPGLKAKQIDKGVVYVPDGIVYRLRRGANGDPLRQEDGKLNFEEVSVAGFYMQTMEVSNADYQLFLEDLLRQRQFDILDSVAMEATDYRSLLPDSIRRMSDEKLFRQGQPIDAKHPILNISHRAAELYAIWLTQVYNQDPKRKDGRKVSFRLPQWAEFSWAAAGGRKHTPYPWGGPYLRNSRGCYLANFNSILPHTVDGKDTEGHTFTGITGQPETRRVMKFVKETDCDDGSWLTVNVDAYYPNDFGLYNMSGNAAEMLAEEGADMGGGWLDHAMYMQVQTINERPVPHPSVGFRLIMVLED